MNAERIGAHAPAPHVHRGSGMKARPPEAAGGRPGPAGRPGHASFPGPSSRTKAGDAAGAGTFVSGVLAASLLVGAALLLAPGAAWGQQCVGTTTATDADVTCSGATYTLSIRSRANSNASVTIRVPGGGGTGGTATVVTASTFHPGIDIAASNNAQTGNYAIYAGASGPVDIVDDTGSGNASRGIRIQQDGSGTATVDVGSQVMIGTSSSRMRQHGIYVRSSGSGGAVTVTNAGTVYATFEGIDVKHDGAATTTVTNSGAVNSLNHGVWVRADGTGPLIVTNSGDVTVTNANQQGIRMESANNGAMTLTATGGAITTPAQGIYMESRGTGAVTIQGAAADAETRSGPTITSSASHGIHVHKSGSSATEGDISITTTGGSITPGTGNYYGIYVQDRAGYTGSVTIDNAADVTAYRPIHVDRLGAGAVTVTNSGGAVLSATQPAIFAANVASDASDVTVRVRGGTVRSTAPEQAAVHARNRGTGDVIATITGGTLISRHHVGLFATLGEDANNDAGQIEITQGGTISARTGVLAEVARNSAADETRAEQPLIDVTWTGTFARDPMKTAANDVGRFPAVALDATGVKQHRGAVIGRDKVMIKGKEVYLTHRYGQAAGIEARVMDLDALLAKVAEGDDPDELMVVEAQRALLDSRNPGEVDPTDSARAALIVSQFREMLEDENFVRRLPVDDDVDADDDGTYSDAEIKAYLTEDDGDRRTFLRDLLRRGLSKGEKAVLRALTTGGDRRPGAGADPQRRLKALNAALADLPTTSAGVDYYEVAWKGEVRALLDNFNVGDVRIAVNGGSIDSRGDGIRAYYVTPHDMNGGISVTVAKGASVTGALAGVYVANAGEGLTLARKYTPVFAEGDDPDELVAVMHDTDEGPVPLLDQLVTVAGTVTGGTDAAVHLSGGGAVIVEEGGSVRAGSSGVAILVNEPGPALVYINGEVRGGEGGDAAVRLTGGGSVVVGLKGRVAANGAGRTITGDGVATRVTLVTDHVVMYREDAIEAHERMAGVYHPQSVLNVRFREHRNDVPTGYTRTLPVHRVTGMLDTSGLDPRPPPPCPDDRPRVDGECPPPPPGPMGPTDTKDPTDPTDDPETGPEMDPVAPPPPPAFSCAGAMDGRCRMYEALPSMLLAMNALPTWAERRSAARDGNGGWARVEASRGKWQARKATTTSGELAYDHRRNVGRAGVDFLAGESGRVGVSVHGLRGKAEMAGVGEVNLSGVGAALSATWQAGEFQVDAQAATTWYDADLKSYTHGRLLKKEASGAGYALGVEMGRRMAVGELMVTPRVGLGWSRVDLLDFIDLETAGGTRAEVSVEEAVSMKGRLGVTVERELGMGATSGHLFGSLDVEQEFSDETEVRVGGEMLRTEIRPRAVHLGLGGEFAVDENVLLRATGGWRTSGSGTSGYGGGLEVRIRF